MSNIVVLPYDGETLKKILDEALHPPIEDIVWNNYTAWSSLSMSAGTKYDFVCNWATRRLKSFPWHVLKMRDASTNIATFEEILNLKMIVFTVKFIFNPSSSSAWIVTLTPYVNESVPIAFEVVQVPYKAVTSEVSALVTIYTWDETWFDVKNKGVFFKVEATGVGELYDPSIKIYKT